VPHKRGGPKARLLVSVGIIRIIRNRWSRIARSALSQDVARTHANAHSVVYEDEACGPSAMWFALVRALFLRLRRHSAAAPSMRYVKVAGSGTGAGLSVVMTNRWIPDPELPSLVPNKKPPPRMAPPIEKNPPACAWMSAMAAAFNGKRNRSSLNGSGSRQYVRR
jgi:hypothetical protein